MTGLAFERPWALGAGLLLAAAVLWLAARRRPADLPPRRHALAAALRAAGLLLASILAASPTRAAAEPAPRRLLVAAAGDGALPLESPPGEEVVLRRGATIPRAVAAALASLGPRGADRVLVLAGDEGAGEEAAVRAIRAAAGSGAPVLVGALPPSPAAAARAAAPPPALRGLVLPAAPAAGVPFRLRWDGEQGLAAEVSVDGASPIPASAGAAGADLTLGAGPHLVAVTLRDSAGAPRGFASALLEVPGPPAVLAVEEGAEPSALVRALRAQGLPVERVSPGAEDAAAEGAAVIVLGEGAAGSAAVERAVRNGRGLLVLGAGPDARGLGRLRGSPVARALPVFLPPPLAAPPPADPPQPPEDPPPKGEPGLREEEGERSGAVVTLLLLVDASGSMGGPKIEMARRAAAAAAATLAPEDRFGMLSFADEPRWEVPLGPAGDAARVESALRGLSAGGATYLLPALQEARRALRRESTAVRHLVVLSDGETPPFGLRAEVEGLVSEGATLSTVGIGVEFDARLLGSLSVWGRGRTWPAVDPARIPQVVTLDTRRVVEAGKEARGKPRPTDLPAPDGKREEPPAKAPPAPAPPAARAAVLPADPAALLEGLGPWPPAVPPEAAPEARLATTLALRFEGDRGPALVLGRHGLGRTAVIPFDPSDWASWEGFPAFAARLVRGLAPAVGGPPAALLGTEAGPSGTRVRFELRGGGAGAAPEPRVVALDPAGDTPSPVPVEREGARRFAAVVPPGRPGPRTVVIHAGDDASPGVPLAWLDGGPAAAPPPDPSAPRRMAAAAGVPFVEGALPPAPAAPPGVPRRLPAGWTLAALAALLLAGDVALRRAGRPG